MLPPTRFLSRLLGLYCICADWRWSRTEAVAVETVTALFHSPPVMYIAGAMALAAGLAIVLGHNVC